MVAWIACSNVAVKFSKTVPGKARAERRLVCGSSKVVIIFFQWFGYVQQHYGRAAKIFQRFFMKEDRPGSVFNRGRGGRRLNGLLALPPPLA
jgi:hypothetical protein